MIEAINLSKHFGPNQAVSDINFKVEKGEILGLLGPNGAGKTTTMRLLTGYLDPSEGRAVIGGPRRGRKPHRSQEANRVSSLRFPACLPGDARYELSGVRGPPEGYSLANN